MKKEEKLKTLLNNGYLKTSLDIFIEMVGKDALEDHEGGYLSVNKLDLGNTRISQRVGKFNLDKKEKYSCLAPEKALRLKNNLRFGHLTSYESRNSDGVVYLEIENRSEQWGNWGGAVIISKYYIFSFSGLPELLDEAFVCFLGLKSGLMSRTKFVEVKKRRENNPYLKLL